MDARFLLPTLSLLLALFTPVFLETRKGGNEHVTSSGCTNISIGIGWVGTCMRFIHSAFLRLRQKVIAVQRVNKPEILCSLSITRLALSGGKLGGCEGAWNRKRRRRGTIKIGAQR